MTLKRSRLHAATGLSCAFALLAACATQPGAGSAAASSEVALKVSALTGTCGSVSTNSPLGEIRNFKLVRTGPNDKGQVETQMIAAAFNGSAKSITFSNIDVGSPLQVTLLGYTQDGVVSWFARKSAVTLNKLETQTVDVTLMASEGFTCVGPDAGLSKLVFPVLTPIGADKILITGGFGDATLSGTDLKLSLPQTQAWLFDSAKGTFTDAGQLSSARGAHSAIYLPKSQKILVVGGTTAMTLKADGSTPPSWNVADAVSQRWELCALGANNQLSCSTDQTIQDNVQARVMPNLLLLTADYVVASGGAPWPTVETTNYLSGDLFDPTLVTQVDGGLGGFAKLNNGALKMNGSRAGSAVAQFVTPSSYGTFRYLIWGGNESISAQGVPSAAGKVIDIALESSNLGDVRFDDSYALIGTDGKPTTDYSEANGSLFFPTLSALGPSTLDSGAVVERFAAIGGARYNNGVWAAPSKDDAFLLTVNDAQKTITIQKMPGLSAGVYLHSATSTGGHVVVSGGLTGLKGGGATLTDFAPNAADPFGPLTVGDTPPTAAATFIARGALAATKLSNDCIFLFGGVADFDDLKVHPGGASDVYCPGFLAQ